MNTIFSILGIEPITIDEDDMSCVEPFKGKGGSWDIVNNNRHLYPNPMKDQEVVKKNLASRARNETPERKERLKAVRQKNIQKAIEHNKGRKRPKHSSFMADENKRRWADNREQIRDSLASTFVVVSPVGETYTTNRLKEFCEQNSLTYVSVWNSSLTGVPVTKGKSKGWLCQKITQP